MAKYIKYLTHQNNLLIMKEIKELDFGEFIDLIARQYIDLETKGHIPKGAVSENVNWEEIKQQYNQTLETQTLALEGMKKTNGYPRETRNYNAGLQQAADHLRAQKIDLQDNK